MSRKKKYGVLTILLIVAGIVLMVFGGITVHREMDRQENGLPLDAFQDEIKVSEVEDFPDVGTVGTDAVTDSEPQNTEAASMESVVEESTEVESGEAAVTENTVTEGAEPNE